MKKNYKVNDKVYIYNKKGKHVINVVMELELNRIEECKTL